MVLLLPQCCQVGWLVGLSAVLFWLVGGLAGWVDWVLLLSWQPCYAVAMWS